MGAFKMTNGEYCQAWARRSPAAGLRTFWMHSMLTTFQVSNLTQRTMDDGRGEDGLLDVFDGSDSIFVQ